MTETAGVYLLKAKHAAALEKMATDPVVRRYFGDGVAGFLAREAAERDAGTGFAFVVEDQGQVVGVCRLHGIGGGAARDLSFWTAEPFRGKGYATLGIRMVLEFAFRNLGLKEVRARVAAADAASRRALERNGFDPGRTEADQGCLHAITKERWREFLDAPALAKLHPGLRAILDAERAAGNEIVETGVGWPEAGSVFVRLRHPFRASRTGLPEGVAFAEINDPHWWTAEYYAGSPRHILAY